MLLLTAAGWSLVSGERTSLFLGFLLTLLTKKWLWARSKKMQQKVFSRWSMVNAAWNVNPLHVWVRSTFLCVYGYFFFFFLFFFSWQLKICARLMKALASPVAESGVQQGSNLSLSGLMSVSICMSMWKQKQKKEDEVYFAFVIFWPRFVFSAVNLSVLLILLLLSLTSPLVVQHVWAFVS